MSTLNGENNQMAISKETPFDVSDTELANHNIQMFSQNQDSQTGHYVAMESTIKNEEVVLSITADARRRDPKTIWTAHYTLDEDRNVIVIFQNVACSNKKKTCVMCVKKDSETGHYRLEGKTIPAIPETLIEAKRSHPDIVFYKEPRSQFSSLMCLRSTLDSKDLLVGFDSQGKPLPLDEVKKNSKHFEAIFAFIDRA